MAKPQQTDPRLAFLQADTRGKHVTRDVKFEAKITRMILTAAEVPSGDIQELAKEKTLVLDDIADYNIKLPVHIVSCFLLTQELIQLFTDITKTPIWLEFFNIREHFSVKEFPYIGVVFRSKGGKILIAHDWSMGELPVGQTRLQRLSADGTQVFIVEPFDGFLALLRQ